MEDIRRQEIRQLAQLTAHLDPAQQIFFQAEYSLHRRNPTTAFLLCLLLGDFGAHYFYFGRNRAGVVRLLFCWTLIPAILALIDARTMTARARRYNASLAHELVLAIQGAVDEVPTVPATLSEAEPRAPVASGRRPVLAAPISTPEMDAIAAAAWVERAPLQDDPRDPPIADDPLDNSVDHSVDHSGAIWPNALARPVQPEPYLPAYAFADEVDDQPDVLSDAPGDAPRDDKAPIWPVPAAWLDGGAPQEIFETYETYEPADTPAAPATATAPDPWTLAPDAQHGQYTQFARDGRGDPAPNSLPASAAIAAAAASAAAIFAASPTNPYADPEDDEIALDPITDTPNTPAAVDEREMVMLYQTAPAPRRESVRVGPPLPAAYDAPTPADAPASSADHAALAALGSALASGLADLLREHPRTRPITRPVAPATLPLDAAPAAHPIAPPPDPLHAVAAAPTPAAASDSFPDVYPFAYPDAYATQTGYNAVPLAPAERYAAPEPEADPAPAHADDWPLWLVPLGAVVAAPLADPVVAPVDAPAAMPESVAPPAIPDNAPNIAPTTNPAPLTPAPTTAARLSNVRRRVIQRVIVRKMALLDGRVVAEATVERQVPVVRDDAEMAARIRMATRDASREALSDLLLRAPEEAQPSIREQLQSLQQPTA